MSNDENKTIAVVATDKPWTPPNEAGPTLYDPYEPIDDVLKVRVTADAATSDIYLIKAVCPVRGVLQNIVNMFIHCVVEEMRQKHITNYEQLNDFINLICRRTAPCAPEQESKGHESGGVIGLHNDPQGLESFTPNPPVETGAGVLPTGQKGKKRTTPGKKD